MGKPAPSLPPAAIPSHRPFPTIYTQGLQDSSALFRHEVAYCLGQRQDPAAVATLISILQDSNEHPMVRHEAGEALGAIATEDCLAPLRQCQQDSCLEVAQTCQLALQRIEYVMSQKEHNNEDGEEGEAALLRRYLSVDPTPPASASTPTAQLAATLIDKDVKIFDRYRAMFALRDRGGEEAVRALASALDSPDGSALLKHEVAYVLGQMQDAAAFEALKKSLENSKENAMVRHEAAEALGSIAAPECLKLLEQYCGDEEPIVADSCVVALDMFEFEQSGEFQYADVGV